MKKLFTSFGWMLILLPFISVAGTTTIFHKLNEVSLTEKRNVPNFNGLNSSGAYDIYIRMGDTESLRLEGEKEAVDNVETLVKDGTLILRNKKSTDRWFGGSQSKVRIYIVARRIQNLLLSGSGDIEVEGTIRTESLNLKISGSGDIRVNTAAMAIHASISGSGDMTVSGTARSASVAISGSGDFNARNFKTNVCDVSISGSGDVLIHAEKELNARVSGSGDISYSGNPRVSHKKSGSGAISKM